MRKVARTILDVWQKKDIMSLAEYLVLAPDAAELKAAQQRDGGFPQWTTDRNRYWSVVRDWNGTLDDVRIDKTMAYWLAFKDVPIDIEGTVLSNEKTEVRFNVMSLYWIDGEWRYDGTRYEPSAKTASFISGDLKRQGINNPTTISSDVDPKDSDSVFRAVLRAFRNDDVDEFLSSAPPDCSHGTRKEYGPKITPHFQRQLVMNRRSNRSL